MAPTDTATDAISLTPKGRRTATKLLDAATVALARDGYGGATLGRIAAEAGLDKRLVVYYFGGRAALLAHVVQRIGERIVANVEADLIAVPDPRAAAATGIERLWAGVIAEPEVPRAYLALLAGGSDEGPEVAEALDALRAEFVALAARQLRAREATGQPVANLDPSHVLFVFTVFRGLLLQWSEDGESAAVRYGLQECGRLAAAPYGRRRGA